MPITTSAKQALRKDRRRNITNNKIRGQLRAAIKTFTTKKEADLLPGLYSILDTAAKKNIINHNKAARLKSQFSKQAVRADAKPKKAAKKPAKKATAKKAKSN